MASWKVSESLTLTLVFELLIRIGFSGSHFKFRKLLFSSLHFINLDDAKYKLSKVQSIKLVDKNSARLNSIPINVQFSKTQSVKLDLRHNHL